MNKLLIAVVLTASALMLASPTSAAWMANQPGSGLATFALLVGVFLIIVLTLAGGGYGVLRKSAKSKISIVIKIVFLVFAVWILVSIAAFDDAAAIFVGFIFSFYAVARGVKMMKWSRAAQKAQERPAYLDKVNPRKLKIAGLLLMVLTPIVIFSGIFFGIRAEWTSFREKAAERINADARDAHKAAEAFLKANPKATVTCADMKAMGYEPTEVLNPMGESIIGGAVFLTCASNMTAASGQITITGLQKWGLKKPIAVITYSGELTPAEP